MSTVEEAKKAMEDYFVAFNAQDVEAIRKHLHFPFSWIINSRVRPVANERGRCSIHSITINSGNIKFVELNSIWPGDTSKELKL